MSCWSGGRGNIERKTISVLTVFCTIINGAQMYEQFLQFGRLYRALILLGLAMSPKRFCVFDLHSAMYILLFLLSLHPSL